MPNLPTNIRIGYKDYSVQPMQQHEDLEDKYLGLHYGTRSIITIDTNHNPPWPTTEIINTLLHESLHGLFLTNNFEMDSDSEERIVSFVANGLTQLFRDNPHLLIWILQEFNHETEPSVYQGVIQESSRIPCVSVPQETSEDSQIPNRVRNGGNRVHSCEEVHPGLRS